MEKKEEAFLFEDFVDLFAQISGFTRPRGVPIFKSAVTNASFLFGGCWSNFTDLRPRPSWEGFTYFSAAVTVNGLVWEIIDRIARISGFARPYVF